MIDRTVHASYPGMEIVRYDRAGKWYLEPTNRTLPRQAVTIRQAAWQAEWGCEHGGSLFTGRKGGSTFDRMMRQIALTRNRPTTMR